MDWYTFCGGMALLFHDLLRIAAWVTITELIPARLFAQAAPTIPDIGSAFDRHGTIGILFWIVGGLASLLVGGSIGFYKRETAWIEKQQKLLDEHFAQKEALRRLEESNGRMILAFEGLKDDYGRMIEKLTEAAWRPKAGD